MKKFLINGFVGLLLLGNFAYATPKEEALESLGTAKGLVTKEKYTKALDEINYAVSKINELLSERLISFIPDKGPKGYSLVEKTAQGLGSAGVVVGSTNSLAGIGVYSKDESSIELTISSGGLIGKAASISNLGSLFGAFNTGSVSSTKTVRVKGYTGSLTINRAEKTVNLSIQVGEKTSISIEGKNMDEGDILLELAKKIDLSGLEDAF